MRYPIKTSAKDLCNTFATRILRYEKYRCWASKSAAHLREVWAGESPMGTAAGFEFALVDCVGCFSRAFCIADYPKMRRTLPDFLAEQKTSSKREIQSAPKERRRGIVWGSSLLKGCFWRVRCLLCPLKVLS